MAEVKLQLKNIQVAQGALQELAQVKEFRGKAAYRVGKLLRKMNEELRDFMKERNAMIEAYGEKNKAGDFVVPKEKTLEFRAAVEAMLDEEITLDGVLKPQYKDIEEYASPAIFADLETAGLLDGAPTE